MFSMNEKQVIAAAIEKILLDLGHPEMPSSRPRFKLHVDGAEPWSYADIEPNWVYDGDNKKAGINPWNEVARDILPPKEK
jgi:hypothetical protein